MKPAIDRLLFNSRRRYADASGSLPLATDKFVMGMETLRLAPPGTRKVSTLLNLAAENLVKGGEKHLFTPMYFFLARKPLGTVAGAANA
ncbi:sterol methyltransferase C-terminal-domain-containing protein [Blyttiomyces helicus]|uniref:Sterol methyltransferase C-terminal-domain-containing protein n=1 Tax=Blyttiomyces helicus TaxID=388810 RepID=A0A4P9WCX1_9FUNG|nr:sterol methyltransferase C-terminal-domain-containing protein [Blyttiomyces helicus]|eukprot:RKO90511.1 sterol methyltransferase C-terminal-domain-containing protein [Blyttiomyces helicus]